MPNKNLGPAVSGYLTPDGRSWETVVTQAGKPILDKELNLSSDLAGLALQSVLRTGTSSGILAGDFLNANASILGLMQPLNEANMLLLNPMRALVNGWVLPILHTGVNFQNKLSLGAGPIGAGAKRTDVVILEVWRRLLSPGSGDGKSASGRIFLNGNVKVAPADDVTLNLADDMLDGNVGTETTKRVQVQFRLRVIQGVDVLAYPTGIDDPVVVANSVPAAPGAPDGVATAFDFNESEDDAGLWVAGDGNPANSLGTVDGYMYAIPICAVFRRNRTAFSRNTNINGGVAYPTASDRPDGRHHDIINILDVADLRRGTTLRGWNYSEILEKNLSSLMDNIVLTEWGTSGVGGGQNGHSLLVADEIGVSNTNGGDGNINGDTPGANFIAEFDNVRRKFSDRVIYETMTIRVAPNTAPVSTATWQAGTVITLDPTALTPYPYAAFNFPAFAPSQTRIMDVLRARIMGSGGGKQSIEVGFQTVGSPSSPYPIASITGLAEFPMAPVVITLGTPPMGSSLSNEPIFIDLLVAYPPGNGLSVTPTGDYGASSFTINNPGALSASAPVNFAATAGLAFDAPHREVNLEYNTSAITFSFNGNFQAGLGTYYMPEKVNSLTSVTVNGSPVTGGMDTTGRILTISPEPGPADAVVVTYVARRPIPQTGVQFTMYYEGRVPQTIRDSLLPNNLALFVRHVAPYVITLTSGSGSTGEAYPYPQAYVQTGGVKPGLGSFTGDHQLDGDVQINVANFGSETGMLRLPTFIPYTPEAQAGFSRSPGNVDAEGRSYYAGVGGYLPNAYAQSLSDVRMHKVLLPVLMELSNTNGMAPKSTLLLALFSRWAPADSENSIRFDSDVGQNTTTVSFYRLNGNLLNRKY